MKKQWTSWWLSLGIASSLVMTSQGALKPQEEKKLRIVTLLPSAAELVQSLCDPALHQVVGITESTPDAQGRCLKGAVSVGPYPTPNIEQIVALKPDWIIASENGNPKARVERLQALGLKVLTIRGESFDQIEQSIESVARILGSVPFGEAVRAEFRSRRKALEARANRLEHKPRVAWIVTESPLQVVGGTSFLHSVLELAGAENVFRDLKEAYPHVVLESLSRRKIDQIALLSFGTEKPEVLEEFKKRWTTRGFKKVQVFRNEALLKPTPRVLDAVEWLSSQVLSVNGVLSSRDSAVSSPSPFVR